MTETIEKAAGNAAPSAAAPAPDARLLDTEGSALALSDLWRKRPLVVVFLRHLGCTFCRQQLAWLKNDYQKFSDAGLDVVCIAQGDPKVGKAYTIAFDLPFPLLMCGEDLSVYKSYGLVQESLQGLLTPGVMWKGFLAMLQGHKQTSVMGDGFQLGGAFIIDTRGIIRYARPCRDAADNVAPDVLLTAAAGLKAS